MPNYNKTLSYAKKIKQNVETEYKIGVSVKWCYYIAKQIVKPNTTVQQLKIENPDNNKGSYISRQIFKTSYMDMAKRIIAYVEKNNRLPSYVTFTTKKGETYNVSIQLCTYMFARILVYYQTHSIYPKYASVTSKCFTKPVETTNEVYNYFIDVFGSFGNTIDGALEKIAGNGYGYYYDDVFNNKNSIVRMKNGNGVNCTDSCQVFYNIMLQLIALGKYKKVECLHIKCSGGDGHVRLRITLNDGTKIYRDPAAVLDTGNITYNWCSGGVLLAVDPSWFMANLNR